MTNLWTWIDYEYEVHKDMQSHTDRKMSMGVSKLHSKSLGKLRIR